MPLFKAFFKILKTKSVILLLYSASFFIFLFVIASQSQTTGESMFQSEDLSIAVYDQCRDELSDTIIRMLERENQVERLESTESETSDAAEKEYLRELNNDVRYGIYDYALILPQTFSTDYQYQYFSTTESSAGYIVSAQMDTFLKCLKINEEAGMSPEEAMTAAADVSEKAQDAEVKMAPFSQESGTGHDNLYNIYRFMCYSLMMVIVIGICTVMTDRKNKDLIRRIHCSALSSREISLARFGASVLFAAAVTGVFILLASLLYLRGEDLSKSGAYILNLLPVSIMSSAFAYLLSTLTADESIINMITNMVSLAMCFMCGVFIEQDYLQPAVQKAAQFMPFYWYVRGTRLASDAVSVTSPAFLQCILIQLLFAAAFFTAGAVISHNRVSES